TADRRVGRQRARVHRRSRGVDRRCRDPRATPAHRRGNRALRRARAVALRPTAPPVSERRPAMAATVRTARGSRPARGRRAAAARPTAFISHASADAKFVQGLDHALQADKIKTWVDSADIHYGALLRHQLTTSIRASTVVVLVWSKAAAKSRWVM